MLLKGKDLGPGGSEAGPQENFQPRGGIEIQHKYKTDVNLSGSYVSNKTVLQHSPERLKMLWTCFKTFKK